MLVRRETQALGSVVAAFGRPRSLCKSSSASTAADNQSPSSPADSSSWRSSLSWSTLRSVLFPVSSAASVEAGIISRGGLRSAPSSRPSAAQQHHSQQQFSPHTSASLAPLPALGSISAPKANSALSLSLARTAARAQDPGDFVPISKGGEWVSGVLFKTAIMLISIPMAVYMIGNTLLVNLCIKGLMNDDPAIIKISLARIRSYVVFDFLAHHFDEGDGVILLLQRMDEGCPPDLMVELVETVRYLCRFKITKQGLMMCQVVERLEKALRRPGQLPPDQFEAVNQLYLDLHAYRRMELENVYGSQPGVKSVASS